MEIKEALSQLDSLNDDQWTTDGSPRVEVVSGILGRPVTRKEVTDAAPLFTRVNTDLDDGEGSGEAQKGAEGSNPPFADEMDEREDLQYITVADLEETSVEVDRRASAEDLRTRKARMEPILQAMKSSYKDLGKQIAGYEAKLDQVKDLLEEVAPNSSNGEAISDYIQAQAKLRMERVERRNIVLQGITEKDLKTKSPLDEAMTRKNTRGTNRPSR